MQAWMLVAVGLGMAGYAVYLVDLRRHLVEPNRASWLIWAAAAGVEAATYAALNPHAAQAWVFAASALACVGVVASMWRRSRWGAPSASETACTGAALAALLLWVAFRQTFWAHMLVVAAVPVSFWPTWASVHEDAARERSPAWGLWTLGDLATLWLSTRGGAAGVGTLAYVLVELGCHAAVWFMVGPGSIVPSRRRGASPENFRVGITHLGKAVFAVRAFAAGEALVRVGGRRSRDPALARRTGPADRFVQIAADAVLGPSGRIDDLVNHSCSPNAGLRFGDDGIRLVAIRPIAAGEELAWDYSTTLGDPDWRMACDCRSAACRGTIAAFATLPPERRALYLAQGIVAPYLRPASAPV